MPYVSLAELIIGFMVMFLTYSSMEQDLQKIYIKIWGVRVYIINGRVTRNKLDDRSH